MVSVEVGGAVSVGDVGNEGTSSIEPRCELEDRQGRDNDALREVSEDLVLGDFLAFFTLSCVPLSSAESVLTLSPV